jgi:type I restriction enzyme M protein
VIGIASAKTSSATTVYDPTCGSGSLLLKVTSRRGAPAKVDLTLYGQEKDNATAGLARMNMILHDCPTAEIWQGNTLANPLFTDAGALKTFDYVVANPPFSDKRWSTGLDPANDPHERFRLRCAARQERRLRLPAAHPALAQEHRQGRLHPAARRAVPRQCRGQHPRTSSSAATSRASSACRPTCSTAPASRPASSCSTKRARPGRTMDGKGIFMIDASKGFRKDGPRTACASRTSTASSTPSPGRSTFPGYARMVPLAEISDPKNDFNLNLPRYIDSTEPEDLQDIDAHLRGGIPDRDLDALAPYWQVFPGVRAALFEPADRPGYSQLASRPPRSSPTIFGHAEFTAFIAPPPSCSRKWRAANTPAPAG